MMNQKMIMQRNEKMLHLEDGKLGEHTEVNTTIELDTKNHVLHRFKFT